MAAIRTLTYLANSGLEDKITRHKMLDSFKFKPFPDSKLDNLESTLFFFQMQTFQNFISTIQTNII